MNATDEYNPGDEEVTIARIVKARGIKGEVACVLETDFPERFASLSEAAVRMPDDRLLELKLENHWFHNDRVILKFEDYDTMTAAETLVGGRVVIAETDAGLLSENQFFEHQVTGSEVLTSEGRRLGHVARLLRTGGTDVLVVEDDDKREYLIPFADDICTEVDTEGKRIVVKPPEGLLEL